MYRNECIIRTQETLHTQAKPARIITTAFGKWKKDLQQLDTPYPI